MRNMEYPITLGPREGACTTCLDYKYGGCTLGHDPGWPTCKLAELKAQHARHQAAYVKWKEEKAKQNADAVRILFLIIKRLVKSPQASITDEDAKLLNEIEARLAAKPAKALGALKVPMPRDEQP